MVLSLTLRCPQQQISYTDEGLGFSVSIYHCFLLQAPKELHSRAERLGEGVMGDGLRWKITGTGPWRFEQLHRTAPSLCAKHEDKDGIDVRCHFSMSTQHVFPCLPLHDLSSSPG